MPPQRALKVCVAPQLSKSSPCNKKSIGLREAVAHLYNTTYRGGHPSQYTYENVCIVPGGRAGLSRVAAVIGDVYCVRYLSYICTYHISSRDFHAVLPSPRLHGIRSNVIHFQASRSSPYCVRLDALYDSLYAHTLPLLGSLEPEV